MYLIFNTISWILFVNFIIAAGLAIFSYVKAYSKGQNNFSLMMLMIAEWSLAASLESAVLNANDKILWSGIEYIGACTCAVFFLNYALDFSETQNKRFKKYFPVLWVIPAIIIILAFTNQFHHLVWQGFEWSKAGNNILTYIHGPAFYIMIAYSLGLVLLGVVFIISSLRHMPLAYRGQASFIIVAGIFPFIATFSYALGLTVMEGLDITVISFVLTGLILLIGILRYRIFNILPLARHKISEIMQEGVIITDSDYKIIFTNPAANKMLDLYTPYQFFDLRKINWLYEFCNHQAEEPDKQVELQAGEYSKVWYNISVRKIKDHQENSKGYLIVLRDITNRKTLETEARNLISELHKSQGELVELNRQKDKLLSIIAHDLRTPFHQILSFARMLSEDIKLFNEEEIISMADGILQAGEQGAEILEDLLAWARSQRNTTEVTSDEISVVKVLEEIIPVFAIATKEKGIQVSISGEKDAMVIANKNMLSIIFRNLIANAVKFSHPGGEIKLSIIKGSDFHTIEVADSGIGIPENDIYKLFNIDIKYTRTGTTGESGTGLGLILCKDLVTRNKGEISVRSTHGIGSTFIVKIPASNSGKEI